MCVEHSEMKKWKNIFKWIILIIIVMFVVVLIIRWNRLDDTVLYADSLGIISNEVTDVVFSVDLADKYNEDTKVNLYIRQELVKEMNDEGIDGDELAGDHIYSCKVKLKIPAGEFENFHATYKHKKTNTITIRGFANITEESLNKSNNTIQEIYDVAGEYEDETTGFIEPKNVVKAVKAVCKEAALKQETGDILDIHDNGRSALIRASNGIWYSYQPEVEGVEALGTNADLRIITMQPWDGFGLKTTQFIDAANKASDTFENVNYAECYMNTAVTLDVINNLAENEVIVFNSHGGYDKWVGPYLTTGQTYTYSDEFSYDCIIGRIILTGKPKNDEGRMSITGSYVKKYLGELTGSMVYLGGCHTLEDDRLANSFIDKGADVVLGFSDEVRASYDRIMFESMINAMCTFNEDENDYGTVGEAIQYAKDRHGVTDAETDPDDTTPAELVYVGEPNYRFFNQYLEDFANQDFSKPIVEEPETTEQGWPNYPIIAYGNFPIFVLTGHGVGFSAYFEDRGSKEANDTARQEVLKYVNEHVSGTDRVFLDRNISRIKPVSKTRIKTQKVINNTVLSYFNDAHQAEGALWRYMVYFYHDYNPEDIVVTKNGVVVRNIAKPKERLYTKKTWLEWAKILILDGD